MHVRRITAVLLSLSVSFLLLSGSCSSSPGLIQFSEVSESGYLIKNVRLFTGNRTNPILENSDVWIHNGQISEISRNIDPSSLPHTVEVIDGEGKTLLPGFIDFHVHLTAGMLIPWKPMMLPTPEFNQEAALRAGITTVVDAGGLHGQKMDRFVEKSSGKGPSILHSGMGFTVSGGHPQRIVEYIGQMVPFFVRPFLPALGNEYDTNPDSLSEHLASNAHFTKIFLDRIPDTASVLGLESTREIVRRSHEAGKPVIVHVGSNEHLEMAIDAGADGIVHIVYRERIDPTLVRRLKENDMFVVPTIVVWDSVGRFLGEEVYGPYTDLEYSTMPENRRQALENPSYFEQPGDWVNWVADVQNGMEYTRGNVTELHRQGVTILAGTDSPNVGISIGGSYHRELSIYVEAGLSPEQALFSATSEPARILGLDSGLAEQGRPADLVLVNGNPLQDINHTRNIHSVFKHGRRIGF